MLKRRENITEARPLRREFTDDFGVDKVQYSVMYYTDLDLENMFVTYEGEPSARDWNLTRLIASQLVD
jgi:hypothetical protein